jgi:hypothetical protein
MRNMLFFAFVPHLLGLGCPFGAPGIAGQEEADLVDVAKKLVPLEVAGS